MLPERVVYIKNVVRDKWQLYRVRLQGCSIRVGDAAG